ncbi:MAG: hypothetical protein Q4D51_08220 [Eubacteriales bacterium]|nr:hypothetical protein [Eubacteriales bacterium]
MVGFIVWCISAMIFVVLAVVCFCSKKAVGFWANSSQKLEVTDVKAYNRAMGILWMIFAVVLCCLGIPLLQEGEESVPLILFVTGGGTIVECIALMIVYVFLIEKKYRIKEK